MNRIPMTASDAAPSLMPLAGFVLGITMALSIGGAL